MPGRGSAAPGVLRRPGRGQAVVRGCLVPPRRPEEGEGWAAAEARGGRHASEQAGARARGRVPPAAQAPPPAPVLPAPARRGVPGAEPAWRRPRRRDPASRSRTRRERRARWGACCAGSKASSSPGECGGGRPGRRGAAARTPGPGLAAQHVRRGRGGSPGFVRRRALSRRGALLEIVGMCSRRFGGRRPCRRGQVGPRRHPRPPSPPRRRRPGGDELPGDARQVGEPAPGFLPLPGRSGRAAVLHGAVSSPEMRNLGEVLWSRPELVRSLPPPWPGAR